MRPPRFRLRTLLVAVAVVAVVLGFVCWKREMERRAYVYQRRAFYHLVRGFDGVRDWIRARRSPEVHRRVVYHDALAKKWHRAWRYPWLPVEPDPPEPEWARLSAAELRALPPGLHRRLAAD